MINKEHIEEFLITMLDNCSCPYTSYLSMPDNNSFTYCIKEIMYNLQNGIKNNLNNNYSKQLIKNFYRFMQKDIVFREVDTIQYSNLMLKLKEYAEGDKVSKQDQFTYFDYLYRVFGFSYKDRLYRIIVDAYENPKDNYDYYYKMFTCFINELLADGINYKYLFYICKQYKNGKFESFLKFIEYLNFGNEDSFDIYLPLRNVIDKNVEYLRGNGQQIEIIDEKYYCKVYSNKCIDFFYVIKQNMTRIEAMFNMLRLYCKSEIDFETDGNIIIESKFFSESETISFNEIICYKGLSPYYRHLERTLESLEKMKDIDKVLYHKVLNIISYAEKDKDVCNHSSYVDNWISLETLCSLSGRKTGYESVEFILPRILASRIITNDITGVLIKSYKGKHKLILEDFIKKSIDGTVELYPICSEYNKYRVYNYSKVVQDVNKLKQQYDEVENRIRLDLLRIYMLRNEYVHESNVHAFHSMQQIKLKNLLSLSLDEFFKTLNRRIGSDHSYLGLNYEIFTQLLSRCEARRVAFIVLTEKNCRVGNNIILSTTLASEEIGMEEFILNVLKSNLNLFRKYIPSSEY